MAVLIKSKEKEEKLTDREFEAILWAVGNFTNGDYTDCGNDRKLYSAMQKAERKLLNVSRVINY